jgi:hypothetical protein
MIRSKIASRFKRAKTMTFLWAWLALVLHVIPGAVGPAHAQGSRKDDIVFNSRGIPLAGATVRVCAMPASGQPCTPLALIYSDAALTQALANPTTTDGLGNYFFYAAPGKYEIEVSGPGITTKQIPNVILPNDPASPNFSAVSAFSLNLSGNLTVNGNTSVVGNIASGTLNLANQSTPPGAAGAGTVNLYTKTADKRLYYKDDTGTELGPLGPGAQTNVANNWTAQQNFNANQRFKGPNPYVDVTAYGVRDVNPNTTPAAIGLTASISSGSTSATISSASTFQNGDGVVIYGAGAPQSMTTPGAPTVTPSVARVGTGTGDVVNGPSGSTTYNYQIIARDKNGGLTAASTVGSTTTGAASLGSQSVAITSSTRANDVVTVVTSAAHGLTVGSMVYINGTSDNSFGGWYQVASAADSTHFTFSSGLDTRNGATASSTGGTVFWFNCNHLTWTAVTGAWEYYIYGRTGASLTLIGVSRPSDIITDLTFDDFGSPMMDNVSLPPYVPSTPPSVATSDHLVTTIASGAGTTTLTLANSAGTTVSGATIRFDNAPNLLAAAQASTAIYIPVPTNGGSYVVNSFLDLTSVNPTILLPGGLYLNETIQYGSGSKWYGDLMPQKGSSTQFDFKSKPAIAVNTANPGLYGRNSGGNYFDGILFSGGGNGQLLVLSDGSYNHSFDNVTFSTGTTTADYMGVGLLLRGGTGNAPYSNHFTKLSFSGAFQSSGATATPLFFCNQCGVTDIKSIFLFHRGILYRPDTSGGFLTIDWGYEQGGSTPFLTVTGTTAGGNAGGILDINHISLDTMAHPTLVYLPSVGTFSSAVRNFGDVPPSSGVSGVTGNRLSSGVSGLSGQNRDSSLGLVPGITIDSVFQPSLSALPGSYSNFSVNSAIVSGNGYPIFVNSDIMPAPTCSVSAGGSLAVGSYTFKIVPVWANGAMGNSSLASTSCSTTSGNQTITVNWVADAGNPKGYDLYTNNRLEGLNGSGNCSTNPQYTGTSVVLTSDFNCGGSASPPSVPAGGPTMMMPGTQGMATPQIIIGGGGVLGPPSAGFTATRTQTLPDVTGYVPVTSYVNSAYDNATRANGAIGSNWTVTNNGINITSNNFVGAANNTNDVAYWSANTFSPVQFSQVTIAALNGTTDFPGVAVLLSGSGALTQGYECVEDTTTILLQKISGTTNTMLTSASSTGAAGDILRLEAAPGGALTCYKNGVSALTTTDTTYTSGAPGLFLFGTVATSKNWSGGNLHPLAQLDSEQDWTKTQHFAQGIALGGVASESFNNNPRAEQNVFLPGALTSTWTGATWTIDKAVTITRLQVQAKTAPAGCTTSAVVRLTDGTTPVNVTISAAANDSGAISQNYAAGASLTMAVQTAAAGCTTSPADANVVVQYRMQ